MLDEPTHIADDLRQNGHTYTPLPTRRATGGTQANPKSATPSFVLRTPQSEVTWADPLGSEARPWQADLTLSAFFLAAASLLLAFIDPVYLGYSSQVFLTLLLSAAGAGALMWGVYKADLRLYFMAAAYLFLLLAVCLASQPAQLGAPLFAILPLRVALFAIVFVAWVFLMRPPLWARRALVAIFVPAGLVLVLMGGPVVSANLQGVPILPTNFSPYWVAVSSSGTIYATNADGNSIWLFDPSGVPVGTLWPATAGGDGQPGPGVLPLGYPTPVIRPNLPPAGRPVGPPLPRGVPSYPFVAFCGIAIDPHDNLLVFNTNNNSVMKFSPAGDLIETWTAPDKFEGAKGCIGVDAEHIYLASRFGDIYVLDMGGRVQRGVKLSYQPFGMAPDRRGNVLVTGPFQMHRISASTGEMTDIPLPEYTRQLRIPYQTLLVTHNGDLLTTDVGVNQAVRIAPEGGVAIATYGDLGFYPGQFQGLGGTAEDPQGRILVADWQNGVIQRFTADGRLDSVMWAYSPRIVVTTGEENE